MSGLTFVDFVQAHLINGLIGAADKVIKFYVLHAKRLSYSHTRDFIRKHSSNVKCFYLSIHIKVPKNYVLYSFSIFPF